MKNFVFVLILLLFIPLVSFGQDFDFNDLKGINSLKQFKKFSFEKEFIRTEENDYIVTYAQRYDKNKERAFIWAHYYPQARSFEFQLVKNYDGTSSNSFNRTLEQVKSKCTFYDIRESDEKEFICYTCPGSAYLGKIGFARGEKNDYIENFVNL
ncbi:MAG: hypothetical protein ACKVGT_02825 [Flavobacteriales bacterium]|tara:strand:- start:444 stop:905 length:462 start_codon:yes stop_codon:yes gene_type:complete